MESRFAGDATPGGIVIAVKLLFTFIGSISNIALAITIHRRLVTFFFLKNVYDAGVFIFRDTLILERLSQGTMQTDISRLSLIPDFKRSVSSKNDFDQTRTKTPSPTSIGS